MARVGRIITKGFGYEMLIRTPKYDGFQRVLDARATAMRNFQIPLQRWGDFLVNDHIKLQFALQGAPTPWAKLSPKYAAWKMRKWGPKPILVASGAMYAGFSATATAFSLTVKNTKKYWGYHQTGTRNMQARKMIQLVDEDYRVLRKIMKDYILESVEDRYG